MYQQMKKLSLLFLILCINSFTKGQFVCDPDADCYGATAGDLVPDPHDCEKYYVCIELPDGTIRPSTSPLHCQNEFYFDQTLEVCTKETEPGICQNACDRVCEFECPETYVGTTYVASKRSCSVYTVCYQTGQQEVSCLEETPYFNGEECVKYESQCCNLCTPYCSQANIEIQDPCDCTAYYICTDIGTPDEALRFSCDPGQYFDEAATGCLPGSCNSVCSSSQCGIASRNAI